MLQKYYKENIMLDSYIIDFLKEEERRKQEEARVPLYIHPPGFDGYRDNPHTPNDANKKNRGYVEVDYEVDLDVNKDSLVIKM
jgi:hypothetical protein